MLPPRGKNTLIYWDKSPYQGIKLYKNGKDYWLSLNDILQFHTKECFLSHAYMVRGPVRLAKNPRKILIIGGGDGFAAREALRCPYINDVTNVELDGNLVHMTKTHPAMRKLTDDAFNDPRLKLVVGDGISYLMNTPEKFDIIIDDCEFDYTDQPDPKNSKKKYDKYLDCMISKLNPGGIACIMEPLIRVQKLPNLHPLLLKNRLFYPREGGGPIFNLDKDPEHRRKWMEKSLKDGKDLAFWRKKTPHLAYNLVDLRIIGPECYIYMSNEPIKIRRKW